MKFSNDAIDETDLLEETLKPRVESIGGILEKVSLSGTHITPCIQVINLCTIQVYVVYSSCIANSCRVSPGLFDPFSQSCIVG